MSITLEHQTIPSLSPLIAQAVEFTAAYRRNMDAHPAIREAMCLKTQYPALMGEIRKGDLLASRHAAARITYVGTMWWAPPPRKRRGEFSPTKQGGYCFDFQLADRVGKTEREKQVLAELSAFWEKHCTWTHVNDQWDEHMNTYARGDGQIGAGANGFCVAVNSDRLLQRGLPGLMQDVQARREHARRTGGDVGFYDGLAMAIDVVVDVARHYQLQAAERANDTPDPAERARLREIARTLDALCTRAPQTFGEAVQLYWLYTHLVSGNHPEGFRIDQSLGGFYCRDIDSGRLTEEQAIELILALWKMISENGADALCRIVIGGKGRRNEADADRFCLAAMEATRRHRRVTPQLTLRFHKDQDKRLLDKAYDVLAEGCCYPMLYNDDVVVPGVARAMHVSEKDAELYYPLGCGEYMFGWSSPSVLCCGWSVGKTIDAALHDGCSGGKRIGPATGSPETLDTFEKLYAAFVEQIRFAADLSAHSYRMVLDAVPSECPFLLASLLTDDCLDNGKGILEGSRFVGACVMGHGFSNAADSLAAIRKVVYERKAMPLGQLVDVLDANYEGHEPVRKMLLAAPKFGNDRPEADELLVRLWNDINAAADEAGRKYGLSFHTVSSVNPGGYGMGEACPATADGRKAGESFAIGHAPTAGRDSSGLTALMNSVAKADAANGGAATNFKLSRELLTRQRGKTEALFASYFASGGQEATITCVNRGDLEAAMERPQDYPNLLVRLGGWCAKFVELERNVQEEILRRTLY